MGTAASNPASSSSVNASTGAIRVDRPRQHTRPSPPVGSKPRAKPSVTLNAKPWEDLNDPAILAAMSMWHAALKDMNKDAKRVHPNAPKIAYFFPHPALFVRGWITHLSASDSSPITPHSWWDFLNMIPKQISSTFSGD
ncbi:hypothetical protein EDC04DRAFT_2900359 [Pisolithus marmoratus]|nr:hypothetical protein EDC04DRAFT_2900359 [Pisolithus marmoratus]